MRGRIPDRFCISGFGAWTAASAKLSVHTSFVFLLMVAVASVAHAAQQPVTPPASAGLQIVVVDENGTAVPSARITLQPIQGNPTRGETDYSGRKEFSGLAPGDYTLQVEKEGYFAVTQPGIHVGEVASAEVALSHIREFSEQVNVVYSPPAVDPAKTQESETLGSPALINLPFPVDRDIRYALPMVPGVLQDSIGQLHVSGASTRQVYDQLDGFNISDPATGQFLTRVSVDAVQSADVASSRYSTEYGKGSGGVISLRTGMGDDHWRFTWTDPVPGLTARQVTLLMINSNSCTASFSQVAGVEALCGPQDSVASMREEFRCRRAVIVEGLNRIPGFTCRQPHGAFYAFPNIRQTGKSSRALADALLNEAGVACLWGTAFGSWGEGYLRFSFANSIENIQKALERIETWVKKTL